MNFSRPRPGHRVQVRIEYSKNIRLNRVMAWMEIHQDELYANWTLAVKGEQIFKIEPLR